ncbi:MAG: hypothetical protein HQK49_17845 [Oligoflexia bacterium]|nr:hypothetical protein [Oligoflexia bacterium]
MNMKRQSLSILFFSFLLMISLMISFSKESFAYSGSCSFVGSNTAYALQQTEILLANMRALRDKENCPISDRSIQAVERVNKYFTLYQKNKNFEHELLGYNAELEQYQMAYDSSGSDEERVAWMTKIIEAKTNQIATHAQITVGGVSAADEIAKYTLNDVMGEMSRVMDTANLLNQCFMSKPEVAANVISGMVSLAGGVASVATTNPIWGSVGNVVGSLVTTLTSFIVKYRWEKYISKLDQEILYHSYMCMIEMQGNYYCEKKDEINVIKRIMKGLEMGNPYNNAQVWPGHEIEAKALVVVQNWIKTIQRGLPPSSTSDAQEQNELLSKVASAEMIQNQVIGKYKKLEETFKDGTGDKYNLIYNSLGEISALMGGSSLGNSDGGSGSYDPSSILLKLGQSYFLARFLADYIPYILITKPDGENYENIPAVITTCSSYEGRACHQKLVFEYIKKNYGVNGDRIDDSTLTLVLDIISKRISFIFAKVNADIDNDLNKRRIKDPEVLLNKAKNSEFPYKLSAEKGLTKISSYLKDAGDVIRKYLKYDGSEDSCIQALTLGNIEKNYKSVNLKYGLNKLKDKFQNKYLKTKSGCPIQLQLTYLTKQKVDEILFNLNNNANSAKNRITNIAQILKFSTDGTLFLLARVTEVLKSDLEARIELGLLTPKEEEMLILKEKDMILRLMDEQGADSVNYNQAIKERETAQTVVRDNLDVFVRFYVLRENIVSATRKIANLSEDGYNREYYDKYGEACAILLSLPLSNRIGISTGRDIWKVCDGAEAKSEWNRIRTELGLDPISKLDVDFSGVYYDVGYPSRICTYRNYLRQNVIYGLKKNRTVQ